MYWDIHLFSIHIIIRSSYRLEAIAKFLGKVTSSAYETEGIVIVQIALTSNNLLPILFSCPYLLILPSKFKIFNTVCQIL